MFPDQGNLLTEDLRPVVSNITLLASKRAVVHISSAIYYLYLDLYGNVTFNIQFNNRLSITYLSNSIYI